ncbi:hypothetical protein KP79_PYT22535 [Mizuhopecten yessoensis]|uniref:BHLH domain-containing protein n=1 Tax=Mizuhopecten yessoensis TaxID=6573 RepID=A0A210PYG4_MIZYE|nr:hypothetical protein KP79_PYT22535 [Mizuhopecten yessoensis]
MSMNSNRELHDNDAPIQEGHTIPERVENFVGNVVTMNGDLEEGSQGQLFICHQEEDANPLRQRERKRSVHNSMEKKRKEKIRYFINKIGELLPPVDNAEKEKIGRSTLDIVEKAYDYIQELNVTTSRLLAENSDNVEEVGKVKSELAAVKRDRDRYAEQLRQAGGAFVETPGQWGQKLGPPDPSDHSTGAEAPLNGLGGQGAGAEPSSPTPLLENADNKPKGNKKKRNTISLQLEIKKQQQQQQTQPMELSTQAMAGNYGNVAMNNMMMNQMMFSNSQMMMQQHMMGVGGQMPAGSQGQNVESSAAELAGAGLIQLAMQDAGITPSTSVSSDENVTSTATQANSDPMASASDNSALETLASIATVPQTAGVVGSSAPVSQAAVSPLVSQSGSAMTATTQAINANMPIMATGQSGIGQIQPNNNMMNVPFVNGGQQQFPPGILQGQQGGFNPGIPTPQQQIMFINEQGVPCIANVPLGIDPNSLGIPNFQKQMVGMDKSGNIGLQGFGNVMVQKDQGMTADQTLITNMNLQGQQTFQQTQGAVAMGTPGMVQPPMPLGQQVMQPMHQLAGGLGNQGQQGLIMPVSQSGNLLINSTNQNQGPPGNQLPQALLLPNGQIIPVVANPQTGVNSGSGVIPANTQWQGGGLQGGGIQQPGAPQGNLAASGAPPRMSLPPGIQGSMMATGMDGTIISGGPNPGNMASSAGQIQVGQPQVAFSQHSSNMGLLMTTASNLPGTNAVANSSVSQPLSETGQTGNVIDSVATNKGKTLSVTAGGTGQQSGLIDTKQSQNMLRFPDSDLSDQARGSQIIMKSTGQAGVFPNKSGRNTELFGNEDEDQTDLPTQPAPTTKKSKSKKSKASKAATVVAASAAAESATQDESATDTTDILAKAAESIFSSDISPPIGGFYNPANEDNPLQIDTSAGETEEDPEGGRTPRKEPDVGTGPPDSVREIQQVKELHIGGDGSDILGTGQTLSHQEVSDVLGVDIMMTSRGPGDILSNMSTATSIHSDLGNLGTDKPSVDIDNSSGVFSPPSIIDPPKKSNKKSKKAEKEKCNTPEKTKVKATEDEIQNTVKEIMNSVKNNTPPPPAKKSGKKLSKKAPSIEKPMTTPTNRMEPVEAAEPVMAFPDTIIFSEKELSDVLDQVENLGSSLSDSSQTVTPPKKIKSKKNKGDNLISDSEPASKKQKKGSARDKSKSSAPTENVGSKSSMSVYDFEEDGQEEFSSPLRSLQTKRNSSSINNAPVSNDQFIKSATSAPIGVSSVSPMRVGEHLPFSSRVCSSEGRLFSSPNQLNFSSSPRDTSPGFADDSMTERPLFDTQLPLPAKEKKSKKRSKSKKTNKTPSPAATVRNLPENDILLESQKLSTVPEKTISSVESLVDVSRFERTDFDEFEPSSKKKEDDIEKMDIDLLEKSPEHSTPKKDPSECLGLRTSTNDGGLLSCVQNSVIMDEHLASSVPHRDLDSSHRDPSPPNSVALTDPVHISTHSLASSENSDIDNTMNSILGLSAAAALSPHIISPGQQQPVVHHVRVSSPQLQTPKSTSPVSMTSPQQQSLQHSVLMSVASADPLVSRASSVTSCSSMTNFSSPGDLPYSAETLFNPSSDKATLSSTNKPTSLAISRQDSDKSNHGLFEKSQMGSKARNGIYSADNFVQTNKDEGLRTDKSTNQVNVISPPLSSSLSRIGNENSSDVFNFATIGLNIATPTTSTTSIMDSLNMSPIISTIANTSVTSSSFTFTLSSVTSTSTTSSAGMTSHDNHQSVHPYPFYSPQSHHHLPSSSSSSNMQNVSNLLSNSNNQQQEQQQQQQQPSLTMPNFDLDLGTSVTSHLGHQQKRSSNDTVAQSHIQSSQSQLFYGMASGNRASCSVQNQQREPQEQPPMIPNITVSSHNPISKSQSDQIHNTHKRMQELGQGPVRSGPPPAKASNTDHRGSDLGAMERQFSIKPSNSDPRGSDLNAMERQFNLKSSAQDPRTNDLSTMDRQFNIKSTNPDPRGNDLSAMDRQFNIKSSNTDPRGNELANMERQQFSMNNVQAFFPPPNFSNAGSQSMNTHPLRHPPLNSMEERSGLPGARAYEPIFSPHTQGFNPASQGFGGSRYDSNVMFPHQRESSGVANRSLTPFFGLAPQNLSPPARNMQNEGPGLFAANLFGAGPRHTATASMPKNAEISAPYNPLFPPGRPQNGLGLNFQPGFGMNTVHGGMSNAPSITPHSGSVTVTPHMSNFSLTNIFSDVNNSSQNDLNISPIKFPHSNSIMPHQGMDPNALQHPHHQGGSIYHPHNRSHPPPPVLHNAMSINSILGQHHHSFDSRGVPQGMNASAPPFHGPGHPPSFAMPPLNFSMHDP